ncbi:MAG: DUF6279 family lipoprotein [Pseudomonadaceae bacterium]|nr:DUF6279 family lipoprotein [Pseudomonadaceae bacterium]
MRRSSALSTLALLASLSLLAACSRLDLAYRNLDWLLTWRADQYLDLNRQQKAWLRPRLQQHRDWHCSAKMPQLAAWLEEDGARLASGRLHDDALLQRLGQLRQALDEVSLQVAPTAAGLLQQLSPQQVAQLRQALAEENAELHREFVEPPPAERLERRRERMEERLQPWFGELDPAQRDLVARWAGQLEGQSALWLDSRERWQAALLAALEQPQGEDFAARIEQLIAQRQRYWSEDYRAAFARSERALAELLGGLIASSSAQQRQRLQERLNELRADIAGLGCETATGAAVASRSD